MITRERVVGRDARFFNAIWRLYTTSFPELERREIEYFFDTISTERCHLEALLRDDTFVGMLCWWELDGFWYVEYLATEPELRGGGLGRDILEAFIAEMPAQHRIILEVEHPCCEISSRRIGFYERLGFVLNDSYNYSHPSYTRGSAERVPLLLMSYGGELSSEEYARFCEECFSTVHF